MILKLIKTIIDGSAVPAKESAGASSAKRAKDNVLVDVAHEAIRKDAEKLSGILSAATSSIDRKKKKEKIKGKVKKNIDDLYDNDDIVEEVTERVLDAAEFDPYYEKMFDENK